MESIQMKIIALKFGKITTTVALIYVLLGCWFWLRFCFSSAEYLTLPIGFVAPMLSFNFDLRLHRAPVFLYNLFLLIGSIGAYAFTGWFTSAVAVAIFNLIAKLRGGIDADFMCFKRSSNTSAMVG
jgi:hypothetical protein